MIDFGLIYDKHFKDVYRFIYSLCRNESIAEEITQETFMKALTNIDAFQGNCQLKVWLCQIAKNTLYTYQRKQNRMYNLDEINEDIILQARQNRNSHEQVLTLKEDAFRIHQIIHNMNEPYKEVFTLRLFGELSFNEIGQLFKKSDSWARVTYYRAKEMIHKKLEEE